MFIASDKGRELIFEVASEIERHHVKNFNMDVWFRHDVHVQPNPDTIDGVTWCGTTVCFAGGTVMHALRPKLHGPDKVRNVEWMVRTWPAQDIQALKEDDELNLGDYENVPQVHISELVDRTFFYLVAEPGQKYEPEATHFLTIYHNWPDQWKASYQLATTMEAKAAIAAARFRHFARTGE